MNSSVATVGQVLVGPGATLAVREEDKYLRGYNTFNVESTGDIPSIVAAISGLVEVTDCVVSVRGLSPRYLPEVGDVVVGRIVDVAGNRWRVDLGALQDAIMMLSSVTEPGGILRRKGRDDELSMRKIFKEDDVVVAEVQRVSPDGLISLHTRTAEKYGKMSGNGSLVKVKPSLIRRTRHQFRTFIKYGVHLVVGMNGAVWVELATRAQVDEAVAILKKLAHDESDIEDATTASSTADIDDLFSADPSTRLLTLALFTNCVHVLGKARVPVYDRTVLAAVERSQQEGWRPTDVLAPENRSAIFEAAKSAMIVKRRRE